MADKKFINRKEENSNMIECPKCHHNFSLENKCKRCNHKWRPRSDEPPMVCPNPKCKSPYWNKPRQRRNKK